MGLLNYTIAKINELLGKVDKMPDTVKDGKTPVLETGTTTTLSPAESATSEVVRNGEDSNGNPRYKINLGIPKGRDGTGGSGGGVADSVDWSNVLNKPSWVNSTTKPTYTASDVGALPADTLIPSKTSQLDNDSEFISKTGLKTINGQSVVGTGNITISGGGGGGNVNVTNAGSLLKGKLYSFSPSAEGSLNGTFSTIPEAGSSGPGLMGTDSFDKLERIRDVRSFPVSVLSLPPSSSSDDILTAFGFDPVGGSGGLADFISSLANGMSDNYTKEIPKIFIGNHECGVYASHESTVYNLELSYMTQGGKLKTVKVEGEAGSNGIVAYSVALSESGDDDIYLPASLFSLTRDSTKADVAEVISEMGGADTIFSWGEGKKFFLFTTSSINKNFAPVSVSITNSSNILYNLDFYYLDASRETVKGVSLSQVMNQGFMVASTSKINMGNVMQFYTVGAGVYSLSSDSTSDDIQSAFSSIDGFKSAISAALEGAMIRTSIPDSLGLGYTNPVYLNVFSAKIADNGDMNLAYFISGLGINGFIGGNFVYIDYTASADINPFSITMVPISTT